ncbi:MAG TPA: hypothetical protein VM050_09565 [Patescibacteria group bacterium]|nr:hypothetical protein [Patescibacteria group bacterium]
MRNITSLLGLKNRRANASVVKTILFLGITIAFSLGMMGLLRNEADKRLSTELIEVYKSGVTWNEQMDCWDITLKMKNKGPNGVTMLGIFLNGIEVDGYGENCTEDRQATTDMAKDHTVVGGETKVVHIYVDGPGGTGSWQTLTAGTSLQISVQSASGMGYPINLITV